MNVNPEIKAIASKGYLDDYITRGAHHRINSHSIIMTHNA